MSLLSISIQAGILIAVITIIRALTINHLPKKTFIVLWGITLLRLITPLSLPSPLSVYSLANRVGMISDGPTTNFSLVNFSTLTIIPQTAGNASPLAMPTISMWLFVWGLGAVLCASYYALGYLRYSRKFAVSCSVENDFIADWLRSNQLKRKITVRQSDFILTPLTYGILQPVILMPPNIDWTDTQRLRYVLAHEYEHIRRFDSATKILLTLALCIHWFNPLVWAMYVLSNQDLELSCDEAVVHTFGETMKSAYALTLINMEERKKGIMPFANNFSKNAIEERIKAIMNYKKTSIFSVLVAALLVGVTTTAFALNAPVANSTPAKVKLADTASVTPQESTNASKSNTTVSSEIIPLHINSSKVQFDDSLYHWPSNVIEVTNTSDQAIMDYEIVCLAYDKNGKALELYWDAKNVAANGEVGSIGFASDGTDYGIVTGIYPVSPKAFSHVYRIMQQHPPADLIHSFEKERGKAWVENWLREWKQSEESFARDNAIEPKDIQTSTAVLFDGWKQSTGEHNAKYIITCIKQVTFTNGEIWTNPAYDGWLKDYQANTIKVSTLENYYN